MLVLLLSLVTSCASNPPDVPICVEIEIQKGFCVYTMSNKEYTVEGLDWLRLKVDSLIVPADSWAKIKDYFQRMCVKSGKCNGTEMTEKLNRLGLKDGV